MELELSFKCSNLPNLDVMSKTDAFISVSISDRNSNYQKTRLGQTEVVCDNLCPVFSKTVKLNYQFEEVQEIFIEVWDNDSSSNRDTFIGQVVSTVGEIVAMSGTKAEYEIDQSKSSFSNTRSKHQSTIIMRAEVIQEKDSLCTLKFCAHKLDKKDLMGKSDPLLELYKFEGDSEFLITRTEYVKQNVNPVWRPIQILHSKLCSNKNETSMELRVLDWNRNGKYSYIGSVKVLFSDMKPGARFELYNLRKIEKHQKPPKKNNGILELLDIKIENLYTFTDFLSGGLQIQLVLGIDFTASNGNPQQPGSLHFLSPAMNEYQQVIVNIGQILLLYNSHKIVSVHGFGARFPNGVVSQCFNVNGNLENPNVFGIQGVMEAYNRALSWITLYGPTDFAPVIEKAVEYAMSADASQSSMQSYVVLLIITDGEITDMQDTMDVIVRASLLPLSIVIVGVGSENFSKMNLLDADDNPIQSRTGQYAHRDIVQFVEYRQYKHDSRALAANVLKEIPQQVTEYMRMRGIRPREQVVYY